MAGQIVGTWREDRYRSDRIVATIAAAAIFGPIIWMAMDRMVPYEITGGEIEPVVPTKGGQMYINWDIKALRACQPQYSSVTRVIIDSQGFRHVASATPATYGTPEQHRPDQIRRPVKLPENITGPAQYYSDVCYACNPLQVYWPICFRTPIIDFMIADKTEE